MLSKTVPPFWLVVAAILWITIGAGPVAAQSGGPYDLDWNTVDGGGYTSSTGGSYALGGTIGQPEAGVLAGGSFVLSGGFWRGGAEISLPYRIYLPLVMR